MNAVQGPYLAYVFTLLYGMGAGMVISLTSAIYNTHFSRSVVAKNIFQFCQVIFSAGAMFLCINYHNYGQFRLYLIVTFLVFLYIEEKTLGKLIALFYALVYNKSTKALTKFKSSAAGKIIFK